MVPFVVGPDPSASTGSLETTSVSRRAPPSLDGPVTSCTRRTRPSPPGRPTQHAAARAGHARCRPAPRRSGVRLHGASPSHGERTAGTPAPLETSTYTVVRANYVAVGARRPVRGRGALVVRDDAVAIDGAQGMASKRKVPAPHGCVRVARRLAGEIALVWTRAEGRMSCRGRTRGERPRRFQRRRSPSAPSSATDAASGDRPRRRQIPKERHAARVVAASHREAMAAAHPPARHIEPTIDERARRRHPPPWAGRSPLHGRSPYPAQCKLRRRSLRHDHEPRAIPAEPGSALPGPALRAP